MNNEWYNHDLLQAKQWYEHREGDWVWCYERVEIGLSVTWVEDEHRLEKKTVKRHSFRNTRQLCHKTNVKTVKRKQ